MIETVRDKLAQIGKKYNNSVFLYGREAFCCEDLCKFFDDRTFGFALGEGNLFLSSVGFIVRGKMPILVVSAGCAVSALSILRESVCVPNLNVKIVAFGGEDLYDVELMRLLPNMQVYVNDFADAIDEYGPAYLRFL